jgi:Predicted AAA-ATPase.
MSFTSTASTSADGSLKPPVGVGDFGQLYREGYTFVDKSLLIREVLEDSAKVTLIVRPRRFGKTLNLSMLHHFFASEVRGYPTRAMFDWLAVSEDCKAMAHQGEYSVI